MFKFFFYLKVSLKLEGNSNSYLLILSNNSRSYWKLFFQDNNSNSNFFQDNNCMNKTLAEQKTKSEEMMTCLVNDKSLTIYLTYFWYQLLLRLRVKQKALQLPLFSSLSFSLQQIWTNWRKLLVEFFTFINLDECGSIRKHWRNMWQIFIPVWNSVCENITCHVLQRKQ